VTPGGVGERLVTVLLTVAVPEVADPEDAAALVAQAAAASALEVRHAVGVEGHLPAPAPRWSGRAGGSRGKSWRALSTHCSCGTWPGTSSKSPGAASDPTLWTSPPP